MTPANLCEEVSLINEGANLFAQGSFAAAQKYFWQAFQLRPNSPVVLFNLGRTMEELGDPKSIYFYEAAAAQGSTDASYQLAMIYVQDPNNKEATIRHLKLYLKKTTDTGEKYLLWAQKTLNQLEPPKPVLKLVWSKEKSNHAN